MGSHLTTRSNLFARFLVERSRFLLASLVLITALIVGGSVANRVNADSRAPVAPAPPEPTSYFVDELENGCTKTISFDASGYASGQEPSQRVECYGEDAVSPSAAPVTGPDDTPPAPNLVYPANGSQINTLIPQLRVNTGVTGRTTSLFIELSVDSQIVRTTTECGLTSPQYTYVPWTGRNLAAGIVHSWRARIAYGDCRNGTVIWGPFSSSWTFRTGTGGTIPPAPRLLSPPNNSTIYSPDPIVTWQGVPGAKGFSVVAKYTPYNGFAGFAWDSTATSHQFHLPPIDRSYDWYVQVRNDYAWSAQSSLWRFTVASTSISGRITDANGAGIPNVTVTDSAVHSTTTDSNGNYVLTGLYQGNYTITPSRSGYAFCPRARTATVPPSQTGRNFTGSPTDADLGFCPNVDGFSFANKKLWRTWPMFEQFYGSQQVRKPDGSICATAQRYFDETYRGVANGLSCVGFTLGSLHSFQSWSQPNAGAFAMPHYESLYDQPLSHQLTDPIAFYSGVQLSQQFQNGYRAWKATCTTDPNQMVDRLRQAIQANNPLLLGLKAGDVYHAVTPYRVVTVSTSETYIYVYDNEAPGQTRVVRLQRSGSSWQWQYTFVGSLASAETRTGVCQDMYYYQAITSLERGSPLVDLCEETATEAPAGTNQLLTVLPAAGDWVIRDTGGRRLGWTGGQWVAEIPGGYALPQSLGDATLSYRALYLPASDYTVQANAGSSRQIDYNLFADGRVLDVNGQTASAGTVSVIDVSPGLDAISVTQPANLASLVVDMTRELPAASRVVGLTASAIAGDDDLVIAFDGEELQLSRAGGSMEYWLRFFQPGRSSGYFITEPITLGADEAHMLRPSSWNGLSASTVALEIDEGRDGTIDETVTLENTARSIFLPTVPGS